MLLPNSIFRSICSAIEPTLILHGFSKTEDENHPEIFGSQYTTFENEKERFAFYGMEKSSGLHLRQFRRNILQTVKIFCFNPLNQKKQLIKQWMKLLLQCVRLYQST